MDSKDVTAEILLRLPLKSLTRCKSLSKEWNSFISRNSHFRRTYLSRLASQSPSSPPLLLGFFFNRDHMEPFDDEPFDDEPLDNRVHFLPTSTQGEQLVDHNNSPLPHPFEFDESLSFMGHPKETRIFLVASSNGFLLCCLEEYDPITYIICNPITKEWVSLPKPTLTGNDVPTGFTCQGNYPALGHVHYTVVRGLWPHPRVFSSALTIEIFSSKESKWRVLHMTCPSPFHLEISSPSVVIDEQGVVHWLAITEGMERGVVVFDPRKEHLQLVASPGGRDEQTGLDCLTKCDDGLVLYARVNDRANNKLQVWVLEDRDDYTKQWSIKYEENMVTTDLPRPRGDFAILDLHPNNPRLLFLGAGPHRERIMSYDVKTSRTELICDLSAKGESSNNAILQQARHTRYQLRFSQY